jgi:phosphoglycerate dehydrogenase-like enzyme
MPTKARACWPAWATKPLMILRNHGLLALARPLPLAFVNLWTLQRACDVQVAQAGLGRAIAVPEAVAKSSTPRTRDSFQFDAQFGAGQDVFDAMTRLMEKRSGTQLQVMKACIYGAGAIGGWIGVRLAQAGCEVSVVARGATLEALKRARPAAAAGGETLSAKVNAAHRRPTSACRTWW